MPFSANRVDVLLTATDRISPVLSDVRRRFDVFGNNGRLGDFGNITSALGQATRQSNLFWSSFNAGVAISAVNTVTNAFQRLARTINTTAQIQTKTLADAGSLASVSGISLDVSENLMNSLNAKLAVTAGALPGEANDYIGIANTIAPLFARQFDLTTNQGLKSFESELIGLTEKATFLGQTKGVDNNNTAMFLNRFMSGESFSTLKSVLQFGENNPAIMQDIEGQLKAKGYTTEQFEELDPSERMEMLKKALNKAVSPELIKKATNTADAIQASMKDKLFSPQIGIFGLLRKVDMSLTTSRSVMDAYTDLLRSITNLGSAFGELGNRFGLSFDPLRPVIRFIDFLTNLSDKAASYLKALQTNPFEGLGQGFKLPDIGGTLAKGVNVAIGGLFNTAIAFDSKAAGLAISGFINGAVANLASFLNTVDWHLLGRGIGVMLEKIANMLLTTVLNINFDQIAGVLGAAWFGFVKLCFGIFRGVVDGSLNLLKREVDNALKPITSFFRWLSDGFQNITNSISNVFQNISNTLSSVPTSIGGLASNVSGAISSAIPDISLPTLNLPQLPSLSLPQISLPGLPNTTTPTTNPLNTTTAIAPKTPAPLTSSVTPQPSLAPPLEPVKPSNTTNQQANNVTVAPVINLANNPTDPNALASLIIDQISKMYGDYTSNTLTA